MAAILSSASGSFGGAVLSAKNGREGTMRERVVPANPKSAPQQNVRGAFGTSSKSFKSMPELDADAWDEYGKTQRSKQGKPLSGVAAYNRLAIVYRLVNPGGAAPVAPPAADYLGLGITLEVQSMPGGLIFVGSGSTSGTSVVELLLQKLPAGNSKPTFDAYKTLDYATLSTDQGNQYVARLAPGRYAAAYRFVDKATGQQTALVQLNVLGVTLEVVKGGADESAKPAARTKKAA